MSDLAETPNLAAYYCPGCSPDRDPLEEILTVRWCNTHQPMLGGFDDERVELGKDITYSSGDAEAATNRPWCELVHRAARRA